MPLKTCPLMSSLLLSSLHFYQVLSGSFCIRPTHKHHFINLNKMCICFPRTAAFLWHALLLDLHCWWGISLECTGYNLENATSVPSVDLRLSRKGGTLVLPDHLWAKIVNKMWLRRKKNMHHNSKFFNSSSWFCAWTDDARNGQGFEPLGGLWVQGGGNQQRRCGRTQHAHKTDPNQSCRYPLILAFLFMLIQSHPPSRISFIISLASFDASNLLFDFMVNSWIHVEPLSPVSVFWIFSHWFSLLAVTETLRPECLFLKCLSEWFNAFGLIERERLAVWPRTYSWHMVPDVLHYRSASVKTMLIPQYSTVRWAHFLNKMELRHLQASCFRTCYLMDSSMAAGDSANQVMIELLLFLFSSQGCTCQCEWRRGSTRRTCYHVGGKKATSFSFEWRFSARCISWHEGNCGRFTVTCVRRLLIK